MDRPKDASIADKPKKADVEVEPRPEKLEIPLSGDVEAPQATPISTAKEILATVEFDDEDAETDSDASEAAMDPRLVRDAIAYNLEQGIKLKSEDDYLSDEERFDVSPPVLSADDGAASGSSDSSARQRHFSKSAAREAELEKEREQKLEKADDKFAALMAQIASQSITLDKTMFSSQAVFVE
jgi:hypothetical protein